MTGRSARLSENAVAHPGAHDEGHQEREEHGRRGAHGDGAHVGAHEARDKGHGQKRGNDRPGCEDRGIAHLVDGLHRGVHTDAVLPEVPVDVLDDDDRVVDEDADGEDEGKEGHAVERVAIEVIDEQGERERHRHRDTHDSGLAGTQGQRDQDDDGDRGDEHVIEQLVGLLFRRLPVVSGHGDVDVRGDEAASERVDLGQGLADDDAGIGALFLGDGNRHGLVLPGGAPRDAPARARGAEAHEDVVARFLGAVPEGRDIPQVDGPAVVRGHDHAGRVVDASQQASRVDEGLAVARGVAAGGQGDVGLAQGVHDLEGRDVVCLEPGRIEDHPGLAALAPDDGEFGHVLVLLDLRAELQGHPPELVARDAGALAPEGEREDGHVVDGAGLDHRLGDAGRDPVVVGHELVVELDEAVLQALAHVEPDDGQVEPGFDDGVKVLDALDLPEELLHGTRDPFLHLLRGGAGVGHGDVDHGDNDLGLLLAGGHDDGKEAEQQGCDHDQRGELRTDEGMGDLAGYPDAVAHGAAPPPSWPPSTAFSRPAVTIRSPAPRPERTSTPPPYVFPVLTRR